MKSTILKTAAILSISALALTGCVGKSEELKEREALQNQSNKTGDSLELKNLKAKRAKEENPDAIRYLYLMNFGQIVGYYVTKGKISSSSSQIAPEQDLIKVHEGSSDRIVMDSAKDDGSYGPGDPGIFFFTSDGVMVETSLDYIQSDQPLAIDVPRLRK